LNGKEDHHNGAESDKGSPLLIEMRDIKEEKSMQILNYEDAAASVAGFGKSNFLLKVA
jgi:hypothetical protein